MVAPQPADNDYRRLYYHLHKLVDQAVGRILDALDASGMADDTIVVFTSDHGDMLGAHGGMQQKWAQAYDEALRVPMVVKGPGISSTPGGISVPTSHVDLIPTLMGLAGIDVEQAAAGVARRHTEAQPLPGRDLSAVLTGRATPESVETPIYFMTEDAVTSGQSQRNVLTGEPFELAARPGVHRVGRRRAAHRARRRHRAVEAEPLLRAPRRVERRARHGARADAPVLPPSRRGSSTTSPPTPRSATTGRR